MIYTGIGSRETPQDIIQQIYNIGEQYALEGLTLRSGGVDGADWAFESGCDNALGKKEIYLPWREFNKNQSQLYRPTDKAYEIAEAYHPAWSKLGRGARALMARNVHQVLGLDCNTPTDFIICWTKDGKASGGTGQAIRIASSYNIRIYNLFFKGIELP